MFRMYCARCCFCHGNVARISPLVSKYSGNSAAMMGSTKPESDPFPKNTTPKRGGQLHPQKKWGKRVNPTEMHFIF